MPSSLWLIPPRKNQEFVKAVQELISDTIPSNFPKTETADFIPHVTLTSDIDPKTTYELNGSSAQQWLDNLPLPTYDTVRNEVIVELDQLEAGEPYFKKLTIRAKDDGNLKKLAARCRREGVLGGEKGEDEAQQWAEKEYLPHLSLMYADIPSDDVEKKMSQIELQCGWAFGSLFDCCGGSLGLGGSLVLVDTSKPVSEWKVIAEREARWARWTLGKNLA